jgi:hypothetical protein
MSWSNITSRKPRRMLPPSPLRSLSMTKWSESAVLQRLWRPPCWSWTTASCYSMISKRQFVRRCSTAQNHLQNLIGDKIFIIFKILLDIGASVWIVVSMNDQSQFTISIYIHLFITCFSYKINRLGVCGNPSVGMNRYVVWMIKIYVQNLIVDKFSLCIHTGCCIS